ncbi:hypothetical protein BEL07_20545 [Mycolicibacterium grossiae]|uniref:Bacterial transcriptional activator domain-containing protein n=1 Tax=Mycolicibacterium grossiae TaxID=1552759 RepID=A0A1E8PZW2_9MYCO|nr:bacterial transcriptional activator domain-containing protein [Mycolicibacterium grossiae]OFJ51852.1 hypothetical protein BEL07_20545 [Mycolicibacterium grossiae]
MTSTALSSTPVTSWWYGQGRAADVVRRLESLFALSPAPPGPAGLVTVRRDELVVTFVAPLKSPLPNPWRGADSSNEARIPWDVVDPSLEPDPDHPVYLVAFGTTDDGGLIGLNLAAFQRIRINGDSAITTALVSRWVLELLATHPDITIGVTPDVWRGPLTTRVRPVAVGRVPQVDVLICGPDLTYTDRAQIVSNAASKIMIDLGKDAAVDTKWIISCGSDRHGEISNGITRPMTATLVLPNTSTVDRCSALLTEQPLPPAPLPAPATDTTGEVAEEQYEADDFEDTSSDPQLSVIDPIAATPPDAGAADAEGVDLFSSAPQAPREDVSGAAGEVTSWPEAGYGPDDSLPPEGGADSHDDTTIPVVAAPAAAAALPDVQAAPPAPAPAADPPWEQPAPPAPAAVQPVSGNDSDSAAPQVATIWNRILGQVDLTPPHSDQQPGPREKRLNELTVFLQHNRFAESSEIARNVYRGVAADKTVTQQVSLLRARLGVTRVGGPKALPPMRDGGYILDSAVRSDWMEFERLVEILIDTTPTANLVAAMDLVTGAPLANIPPKEWAWTKDLRDEIRDRVAGAAVVLAGRHHASKRYSAAVEIARKGLWYDNARQDLWQIGMQAALDGHDKDAFKALRAQYLSTVAGPDRDPAVLDLTKQAG